MTDKKLKSIDNISHYMIDFKNMYRISVENIKSPNNILLNSKILELSIEARKSLIEKLKAFYRLAAEDLE